MKKFLFLILIFISGKTFAFDFTPVDNLILNGITSKYFPGAALIISDNHSAIYEKYYGKFTYDNDANDVNSNSLYDLASVTKVIATTSAIMKLYEKNLIDLDDNVSKYIPDFAVKGKESITIKNLLLHNSGLKAWMPFYKTCKNKSDVIKTICNLDLEYETGTQFVYSDLNFILLGVIVEKISEKSLADFCKEEIFEPLGMRNTFYNPEDKYISFCVPTEYDKNLRKRQLKGEVHDETAYVLNGVSGNAGLFSTANDLSIFLKMMLNNGKYYNPYTRGLTEERLFKEETVRLFTSKYNIQNYLNTRGFGWDTKQEPIGKYRSQCGEVISENCFGHTGYTGTSVWCDRDRNISIVFLTNRVYTSRDNNGIKEIRPELHNLIINILTNK